jgi:hypothetical protein
MSYRHPHSINISLSPRRVHEHKLALPLSQPLLCGMDRRSVGPFRRQGVCVRIDSHKREVPGLVRPLFLPRLPRDS